MNNIFKSIVLDEDTRGNIFENNTLNNYFINENLHQNKELYNYLNKTKNGSILFSIGNSQKSLLLIGGVHGDELPPQVALIRLMNDILNKKWNLNYKLYIIPILIPYATRNNTRYYNFKDMNRHANINGITKEIVDFAVENDVEAVCDCHSTDPNKKPGFKSVFCSLNPTVESMNIARFICEQTGSHILSTSVAGSYISGAVEDESNLRGIPSVTCECVSPVGNINKSAVNESYEQIISFLYYFGAISKN